MIKNLSKIIFSFVFLFLPVLFFLGVSNVNAQELNEVNFFYSITCTHCHDEQVFLDKLQEKYSGLIVNGYEISDSKSIPLLKEFTERYDAERYAGVVPLTFIGESYVVGFNTESTTGAKIENLILGVETGIIEESETCDEDSEECLIAIEDLKFGGATDSADYDVIESSSKLSLFGLDAKDLSLPILSIVLGLLDGFNVCSLGALLLILSLVFTLKSRKKVLLYGGMFLVITGITYAALIFIWFSIFDILSPYVFFLEIGIGVLGLVGGIWFIRQYIRFKKYGPQCESNDSPWIQKMTKKVQEVFNGSKSVWVTSGTVAAFSFVVTVIEFPCSAVIPVAFAGILTSAGISGVAEIGYLGLFMLMYLLDEIVIFLIGVFTLRLWTGSGKITMNLALVQAILFIGLGLFYIGRILL